MPMTLAYWKIKGLAHQIRTLLKYCGEEFEDVTYVQGDGPEFSRASWLDVKYKLGLDFPNLPYFIDGDLKITQSGAIFRHIAKKHNLCGVDAKEETLVNMLFDEVMEFRMGFVRLCYNPDFEKLKPDFLKALPGKLKAFSDYLADHDWLVGKAVTMVDFSLADVLTIHTKLVPNCLDAFPNLKAYVARFEALPAIKEFNESNPAAKFPLNNNSAQFK